MVWVAKPSIGVSPRLAGINFQFFTAATAASSSCGLPLDLVVYEADTFQTDKVVCIDENNPYFKMLHNSWGQRLRQVFDSIPDPTWEGEQPDLAASSAPQHQAMNPLNKILAPDA